MTDSDYNLIRTAEALHNIGDTTPAKYRYGKNKRRHPREKNARNSEQLEEDESTDCKDIENQQDDHSIDYKA